jgi:hypothetical protein
MLSAGCKPPMCPVNSLFQSTRKLGKSKAACNVYIGSVPLIQEKECVICRLCKERVKERWRKLMEGGPNYIDQFKY